MPRLEQRCRAEIIARKRDDTTTEIKVALRKLMNWTSNRLIDVYFVGSTDHDKAAVRSDLVGAVDKLDNAHFIYPPKTPERGFFFSYSICFDYCGDGECRRPSLDNAIPHLNEPAPRFLDTQVRRRKRGRMGGTTLGALSTDRQPRPLNSTWISLRVSG